jgi:hypothetical protein
MGKRAIVVVAFVLALVRWATPAGAQAMACAADREKFCSGVPMGGGRIAGCLKEHKAELSEGCKHAIAGMAGGSGGENPVKAACREDAIRYCKSAAGDQARMKACMQEHAAQLSDACKTAMIAHGK